MIKFISLDNLVRYEPNYSPDYIRPFIKRVAYRRWPATLSSINTIDYIPTASADRMYEFYDKYYDPELKITILEYRECQNEYS